MNMNKSDLVRRLFEINLNLTQRDVEKGVNTVLDETAAALARGDRVELRGFGSFFVKRRYARVGRNPRTGSRVQVAEKLVAYFRAGRRMHHHLNP